SLRMIALHRQKWVISLPIVSTIPLVVVWIERGNTGDIGGMSGAQTGPTYAQFGQRCCHSLSTPPQHAHHFEQLAGGNEGALYLRVVDRPGLHVHLMGDLIHVVSHATDLS